MKLKRRSLLIVFVLFFTQAWAQHYRNPVIPGFHPDPSVCRVGQDFYAVCSSFNYFPGVPIYHSRDLVHWRQVGNVLNRESQLPLKDASSWTGIYAPTIRYHAGTYYLITANVGNGGNFMVTSRRPEGPWSEPIWLEQQGIDPSLYFEGDKCYMVSNPNGVITLCEIDPQSGKQLSPSRPLWKGDGGRYPEGPHIYNKEGYYYLLISEGGTELAHHLTIARSRSIYGPYESNPANPILTNCNAKGENMQLQGTGHGDLVQDAQGNWWVMFLAYRNFGGSYHHLGRETCLAPVEWKKGQWPVVYQGNAIDTMMVTDGGHAALLAGATARPMAESTRRVDLRFASVASLASLGPEFIYLQNPVAAHYQLVSGSLRLSGHGSLTDNRQPTFLGLRQCSGMMAVETSLRLDRFVQLAEGNVVAGLTVYQIHDSHFDLCTDGHKVQVRCRLKSLSALCNHPGVDLSVPAGAKTMRLRITSDGLMYHFLVAYDQGVFREIASQNCALVSTEVAGGFTGVTLGMFAEGDGTADFESFAYSE